jgi:anti-sigma regulatory factor (Ser/Thr protein kinase)
MPCARLRARQVLWEWRLENQAEAVELIVSELVTNAVCALEGLTPPAVALWLRAGHDRVVIKVWDGSDRMPVRQDPGLSAESGRGLMLVESSPRSSGPTGNREARWSGRSWLRSLADAVASPGAA